MKFVCDHGTDVTPVSKSWNDGPWHHWEYIQPICPDCVKEMLGQELIRCLSFKLSGTEPLLKEIPGVQKLSFDRTDL